MLFVIDSLQLIERVT